MDKAPTPKQRIAQILTILNADNRRKAAKAQQKQLPMLVDTDHPRDKTIRKIVRRLRKPLRKLFKKAGANINNDDDWYELLTFIAWAIYSKDPGREKRWTNKRLRRLLGDFTKLKSSNGNLTEEVCCKELTSRPRYSGIAVPTLRRRLQEAKRLAPQQRAPVNRLA
jgi:hypothetical protein